MTSKILSARRWIVPALIGLALAAISWGQDAPAAPAAAPAATAAPAVPPEILERLTKAEAAVANAQTAGDNAWILVSSALVLMMTGPGLALFYGGLVRKKNVLSTMMHSFLMMGLVTVIWALFGYSLAFGEGNSFIGGMQFAMMEGVGTAPNSNYAATIPHLTWMVYQLMFAIITPALISGAFAERIKFTGMMLFMTLWLLLVYLPMAHMVWGINGYLGILWGKVPALDFAGGTVVHITSGVSALVCALFLGKRKGYGSEAMRPHSVVLSAVGACLLWVGWFGFNAGSALAAGGLASSAFVATHFAAAAAAMTWLLVEWMVVGKPTMLGGISGCVAGLVAITPAAGFVKPMPALIIGIAGGLICFFMVAKVKAMFGYDDALDAFGVHGIGGTVGAILTGVFATKEVNDLKMGKPMGLLEGDAGQLMNQIIASAIAWVIAIVGTLVILFIVKMVCGVRTSEAEETEGLDLSQHGEEGYHLEG
jgi:Amt family ammonium transporter